jgi:hypothetical protein
MIILLIGAAIACVVALWARRTRHHQPTSRPLPKAEPDLRNVTPALRSTPAEVRMESWTALDDHQLLRLLNDASR